MSEGQRVSGKLKFWHADGGYGFILVDGSNDVFIHQSDLPNGRRSLEADQPLNFVVERGPKGLRAKQVSLV